MSKTRRCIAAAAAAVAAGFAGTASAGKGPLVNDFGGVRWRNRTFTIGAPVAWSIFDHPDWTGDPDGALSDFAGDFDLPPVAPPGTKRDPPPPQAQRYLEFDAVKSKNPGYAYLPIPRPLWAPFRWETTVGLPNPNHVAGVDSSATFGTQLVGDDFDVNGWSLMAKRTGTGIDVVAADDQNGDFGTVSFAGATSVDLTIGADGAKMFFFARPFAGATWTKVAERPFVQAAALYPVLSAYAVHSGAQVSYDRWRVVFSAPPPGTLTPAAQALDLVFRAHDRHLDELHRIDQAPDLTQTRVGAAAAVDLLDQAAALVSGGQKKKIAAARAAAAAALKLVDKNKPRTAVLAALKKAIAADLAARRILGGK